ncbi:MAG: peptidoglycan bridge formation glycyltransferase FemA/FemB family protein [Firmicutes bacterium]|nr:peptidoglycan bridge formation glycyltransferase FemA/FemB family protein [Bacillota bacterium]
MKYQLKTDLSKEEFDQFTTKQHILSFMQEYGWGSVKEEWEHFYCGLYEDESLVATALVLKRTLPLGIAMMYVPRGYLIDYQNEEQLSALTKELQKLAKKEHAYVLKIDPNFCYREYSIKEIEKEETVSIPLSYSLDYDKKHQNLLHCGYRFKGYTKSIQETLQPRYHMYIPLMNEKKEALSQAEVRTSFKKRIRSYIGPYHEKRGVRYFHTQDKKYLDMFMEVITQTEKRQNIRLRNKAYFEKMMDAYPEEAYLFFGILDLETYASFLKENNGKQEEMEEVEKLIEQGKKEIPLSTSFVLIPNNEGLKTSEYLYAGNHLLFTKLNVSVGLVYEICKYSLEQGCSYCNLGGINGTFDDHLTPFKSRFNAIVFEFAGEYDLPIQKIRYHIYEFAMPILKRVYKFIRRK